MQREINEYDGINSAAGMTNNDIIRRSIPGILFDVHMVLNNTVRTCYHMIGQLSEKQTVKEGQNKWGPCSVRAFRIFRICAAVNKKSMFTELFPADVRKPQQYNGCVARRLLGH
jgi:hypothetical protein